MRMKSFVDLVNAQLAHPSREIAEAVDVPFDCVEAVHMLIARPLDFPEMSIPAILQRTGDIPLHSTDRLILIDTVYYHHQVNPQVSSRPTVVRSVHRLPHQVIRPQILTAAAVYQYCQFLQDSCEVYLDGNRWPPTELEPRSLRHGSYAMIEIPPPAGYDVDTMAAAAAVHHDAHSDAFMELLQDDVEEDDATFLAQVTASSIFARCHLYRIRDFMQSLPLPPAVDASNSVDVGRPESSHAGADNATEVTADTRAQCDNSVPLVPALVDSVYQSSNTDGLHLRPATQPEDVAVPPEVPMHVDFGKQKTLHQFFSYRTQCDSAMFETAAYQAKCSTSQEQHPPNFAQALPTPALPVAPQRPRPIWQIELDSLFDELSRVTHAETGPTLCVNVWYVHHELQPVCHAPRLVELDDLREFWYADLCNAWWDRIIRHEPIKVLMVRPNPDNQLQPRAQLHIILEQHFAHDKVAMVFTAIFLANYRNGIFQTAESVDSRICMQYMIDKHRFNQFCDFRPCNMFSGLLRFHQHVYEEIFSGISVTLVVGPPSQAGSSSDSPLPSTSHAGNQVPGDDMSFMQRTRRWQRTQATVVDHQPTTVQPQLQVADSREFRSTLQWMMQPTQDLCLTGDTGPRRVQTWFLDSYRVTRSAEPRTVILRPHPHTWVTDIIARWQDTLNHQLPIFLHVVQPTPIASTNDIHAHVLVVQTPNEVLRAALLSIVHLNLDPWNPSYLAVMLDVETTVDQIAFVSHVSHPSNPLQHHQQVEVRHASIVLDNRSPFHVRNGYHFDVIVTEVEDAWRDDVALIQLSFQTVRAGLRSLHHAVLEGFRKCVSAGSIEPDCPIAAISITQNPTHTPVTSPWDSLPFHGYLQALWQPLSILSPDANRPTVAIVTWYLDHIRFPQCFVSRVARLSGDPAGWIRQMRRLWFDVILPYEPLHYHIVQPQPPHNAPDVAAHVLLVQQPVDGFRSVLLSVFDSAFIGAQADRFATMAPTPLAFPTLVGLAYRDIDCQDPANTCDACIGREELHPTDARPIIDGHSVAVAVHRPLPVGAEVDDPWNAHTSGRHVTFSHSSPQDPEKRRNQPQPLGAHTSVPVVLCLDACVPTNADGAVPFRDDVSTLLWSVKPSWMQSTAESLSNVVRTVRSLARCRYPPHCSWYCTKHGRQFRPQP